MTAISADETFDPDCRSCPRLVDFLAQVRRDNPGYHAAPVAPFGRPAEPVLIVGLAPGMHGANATGRPFTGDHAGILLYETLHRHGFCNQATGNCPDDGLELINCRITNAVKCLPPGNKPTLEEVKNCNAYLGADLDVLPDPSVVIALGAIAHNAVLRALQLKPSRYKFAHAGTHQIRPGTVMIDSYHCSRYNTQTKRLTPAMFGRVFALARKLTDLA